MAKKQQRSKVKAPKPTPMEQDRDAIRLALKRAVRREREIQQLSKRLERMEATTERVLRDLAAHLLRDPLAESARRRVAPEGQS